MELSPMRYLAVVIARWLMELPLQVGAGRCCNQQADVICMVIFLTLVLRCYAEPHPKCVADGICQCFY